MMYSYSPDAFCGSDVCNKCSVFAALEARLSELEASLASDANFSLAPAHSQPQGRRSRGSHKQDRNDGWVVATGRKRSSKQKHTGHQPLHVSNRFSPIASATPLECGSEIKKTTTLVIGSSIVRNVKLLKTPGATVKCLPGARAGDIESNLKLIAKSKCNRFDRIVIHCGGNDTRRRKSEVTKINVESVCTYAKTMSDTVIFSGPLPNMINDDMYSRTRQLQRWLSRWCPDNNVGFINNWQTFEGNTGLIERDGIHPTWDGAKLISTNMDDFISKL